MYATVSARIGQEEALLVGLVGLPCVAALTIGNRAPMAFFVLAVPLVACISWWRPAYGFALLLGMASLIDEFTSDTGTIPTSIEALMSQAFPVFQNLKNYTPTGVPANAIEIWLVVVGGIWLVQAILAGRLRPAPPPCSTAWLLAALTTALAFIFGIAGGGDVKVALWEVRAFGYLLGLAWLVPQLVERRRDLEVILWVFTVGFGLKAVQGLYRYFVVLGMNLGPAETFMAHEDPVMFVPLFFLLIAFVHYRAAPRLRLALMTSVPIMLLVLVLTQRRIAYVTLMVSAVFCAAALTSAARRTLLRWLLPGLFGVGGYILAFAGSSSPWARPITRALSLFDTQNPSNLYRTLELENLRFTIQTHPWGIGFGQPYEIIRTLAKLDFPLAEYIPHNEVLWIWAKAGTVGFILIMFFFARVVAESTWSYRRLGDPLLRAVALVVGLAVINQLIASYYELQLTYSRNMIYLGTLIGLLGPIREWGGLARRPAQPRWRL